MPDYRPSQTDSEDDPAELDEAARALRRQLEALMRLAESIIRLLAEIEHWRGRG